MKKILSFILFLFMTISVFAAERTQLDDGIGNIYGTSANPIHVNCVSGCSSGGGSITFTDGVHTVTGATQLSVTGGTVGGTTPNATLAITGSSQWIGTSPGPIYYNTGNVGIGTSLTKNLLDISGGVSIGTTYAGYQTAPSNGLIVQGNVGINNSSPASNLDVGGNILIDGGNSLFLRDTGVELYSPSSNNMSFYINGADRMKFDSNGNLGINNVSPAQKLDVAGAILIDGGASLLLRDVGTELYSPSTNQLSIYTNGADRVRVDANGNVGIGVTAPGTSLDVQGSVRMTGFVLSTSPTAGYVLTADANGGGTWKVASGGSGLWATQNTTDQSLAGGNVGIGTTITNAGAALSVMNGNVGIGTWKPAKALDVTGDIRTSGILSWSSSRTLNGNSENGMTNFSSGDSNLAGEFSTSTNVHVLFVNQNGSYFNVGNLGIGTSLSSNELDIAGNVSIGTAYAGYQSAPSGGLLVQGNVGIGSVTPTTALSVNGGMFTYGNTSNTYLNSTGGNVGVGSPTPGATLDVQGTIRISKLGSTISIIPGTNACAGTGTLASGTATISTTCSPSTYQGIFISDGGGGVLANIGALSVGTVTAATSFVVNSANALDSSNFSWEIHKTT